MKTILHISADFPDPLVPAKTRAVEWLLAAAPGFRHVLYSLNRVNWRKGVELMTFAEDRTAIAYGAPPYGLRLTQHLAPVSETIARDLERRGITPDLIHAHKFTIEGIVADALSNETGAPFIASLWGDTDAKIFEAKPGLRAQFRALASRAVFLLPPAPWTARYFGAALRLDAARFQLLPVMTAADDMLPPQHCGAPRLVTVFAWDSWRRKGFDTLVQAVASIAPDIPELTLDVYGRGGPGALMDMARVIENSGASGRIRLMSALPHGKVQQTVNRYTAFVLPSRRETYGMVYVEALLAGVPLLWPLEQGVDGLFDRMAVGYACNAQSVASVAESLRLLIAQEARLKAEIARLQEDGAFNHLRREGIGARYCELLAAALDSPAQAASAA